MTTPHTPMMPTLYPYPVVRRMYALTAEELEMRRQCHGPFWCERCWDRIAQRACVDRYTIKVSRSLPTIFEAVDKKSSPGYSEYTGPMPALEGKFGEPSYWVWPDGKRTRYAVDLREPGIELVEPEGSKQAPDAGKEE